MLFRRNGTTQSQHRRSIVLFFLIATTGTEADDVGVDTNAKDYARLDILDELVGSEFLEIVLVDDKAEKILTVKEEFLFIG
ncbi:hypothetical protein PIB30_034893 [Stylosanthes scabra]|uniref:Uncharacterized protein n=1 Tax=Stylosanthes scabra TaxID=79078 RepID=A0ABU6SCW8_9FABA|nr:hypothetical protein [Stylosanthes scabra]